MFDKVKLMLQGAVAVEQFHTIAPCLKDARETAFCDSGDISCSGYLDGLKITLHGDCLYILGSLAKYLFSGSNVFSLDRHSTRQAIEKIGDSLKLDIGQARVLELEFGTAFPMRHNVGDYLQMLGDYPRLKRCAYNNETLYYKQRGKTQNKGIKFYNKSIEASTKGIECPDALKNMLRYEISYKGRLSRQLGYPNIDASTLYQQDFYRHLIDKYQRVYFNISKQKQMKCGDIKCIDTVADACNLLFARYINHSDKDVINCFIEELKQCGAFADRKNYTRLKGKLHSIANMACSDNNDELIIELDNAVKNCAAYV